MSIVRLLCMFLFVQRNFEFQLCYDGDRGSTVVKVL